MSVRFKKLMKERFLNRIGVIGIHFARNWYISLKGISINDAERSKMQSKADTVLKKCVSSKVLIFV